MSELLSARVDDWVTQWCRGLTAPSGKDIEELLSKLRAQEKELSTLKEPMECGHPKACLVSFEYDDTEMETVTREMAIDAGDRQLEGMQIPWGVKRQGEQCSVCAQHSADLREVAEMASLIGKEFGQKMEQFIHSEIDEQPERQEPDSILREFREKRGVRK